MGSGPGIADLVLEGGGVKGIGLVGAISVLEERGWKFNRVAGTSAGSIVGALVAAGYSAEELRPIMQSLDYTQFRDRGALDHFGPIGKGLSLILEQGIYEGEYLKSWLGEQLAARNVHTFGDLKLIDPESTLPPYKLVVMTSDISQGCLRRLPWDYGHYELDGGPDAVPVVDAVRASMSIPFFYEPVKMKASGGEESWFVDGGMLSNFPVDTFDRKSGTPRWPTFGIKLSARPDSNQQIAHEVRGTLSLVQAMVGTMTGFYDQIHLDDPSVLARTIFVDTTGVHATDFDLDRETQQRLFDNGRRGAEKFLDGGDGQPGWDWEAYLAKFRTPEAVAASATT